MRIGVFVDWGFGDIIISTPVLKYKDRLWGPNAEVVWFIQPHRADVLAYNPWIHELRMTGGDVGRIHELRLSPDGNFKKGHEVVKDLDKLYFPALWLNIPMCGNPYGLVHRSIFGYDSSLPVHPCLFNTPEEEQKSKEFVEKLPYKWNVMLETKAMSGQTRWDDSTTELAINLCSQYLGNCNFIFASPGTCGKFAGPSVVDCSGFTIRQCIPIYNKCHLFLNVTSGIAQATCSWGTNPAVIRLDYVTCEHYSSKFIATSTRAYSSTSVPEFKSKLESALSQMRSEGR